MTIERDETTATKLASVSQRLEAVEVRDALTTCAHQNAHRALSDLEDLNERVMALAEAVGDVDRVTETALGELIAVAGKTATDVTELAKVTADEIATERRKREALERAIVSVRAAISANARGHVSLYEEIKILQREIQGERGKREDLEMVLQLFIQGAREEARERKSRLDKQDEAIRFLRNDVRDAIDAHRVYVDEALSATHRQRADGMDGDPTDGYARRDMIKWNQFQGEAITALSERVRSLEDRVDTDPSVFLQRLDALTVRVRDVDEKATDASEQSIGVVRRVDNLLARVTELERKTAASDGVTLRGMDKLARRIDGVDTVSSGLVADAIQAQSEHARQLDESVSTLERRADETEKRVDTVTVRVAELEEHEHPAISYGVRERIDGVERQAHKRMDNLAMRLTELERRAR